MCFSRYSADLNTMPGLLITVLSTQGGLLCFLIFLVSFHVNSVDSNWCYGSDAVKKGKDLAGRLKFPFILANQLMPFLFSCLFSTPYLEFSIIESPSPWPRLKKVLKSNENASSEQAENSHLDLCFTFSYLRTSIKFYKILCSSFVYFWGTKYIIISILHITSKMYM